MKSSRTMHFILTALFAALICVFTLLVQIPIPATGGYVHLGDGVLLICAFIISPTQAALAAGIGSMLADVFTGYMIYAPGTLIIKACTACMASLLFRRLKGKLKPVLLMALSVFFAECLMVFGYFLYESLFLGMGMGAVGSIPGNISQAVAGMVISCIVTPVLLRSRALQKLLK